MLPEELDAKLCKTVLSLRISGAVINSTTICGILMGLIRADLLKYGQYLDFEVRSFVNSVHKRLNIKKRASTTSRPAIPRAAWEEIQFQFLHKIADLVKEHNVPNVLILNADQTPSKYALTGNITMELKGSNDVAIAGSDDKRPITKITKITKIKEGEILPF